MYKNIFCYVISKEAKIGWDEEENKPCEAYMQVTIDTNKELTKQAKTEMHLTMKDDLANQMKIDTNHLTPITEEEYEVNTDED